MCLASNNKLAESNLLLQLVHRKLDIDRVVGSIQSVNHGLEGGLFQVTKHGSHLPGVFAQQDGLRRNQPERVDHYLS